MRMRSSWPARLLVILQATAEGGWIAVVYSAIQVATGHEPRIGPLELAVLAGMGMAWARRRRWRTPAAEAVGLPLLVVLGGATGWFLDPTVRSLLVDGFPRTALGMHIPGWIAGAAVLRGAFHGSPDDDESVQDRLLLFTIPGLTVPWLVGSLAAPPSLRPAFTAEAFLATMIFAASAFGALGLARLEALRPTASAEWQRSRSWFALLAVISATTAIVGVPAGILLGVPLAALATLAFGLIRMLLLAAILLTTPLILVIAVLTEALGPLFPRGGAARIQLPNLGIDPVQATSPWPTIVVVAVVALLAAFELFVLGVMIYIRWQERRRMVAAASGGFEERSIVIPTEDGPPPPALPARRRRRRRDPGDPVAAYLASLDALARDGRWARAADETPASHAARAFRGGLVDPAFRRLAAAYELVRYGNRDLTGLERDRARGRYARLRGILRQR
jgi:Domain of unknown function (DUF4129)